MSRAHPTVDLGYPTEEHGRVPAFANLEEEGEFWHTHDFTDFADESMHLQIEVCPDLAARLTLRLGPRDRQQLIALAREKGIGPSTLAQLWIRERLRQGVTAGSG